MPALISVEWFSSFGALPRFLRRYAGLRLAMAAFGELSLARGHLREGLEQVWSAEAWSAGRALTLAQAVAQAEAVAG